MKCSKEKYIYSHELMYLSVIKQKQTVFFVTSCVSHNINKNKLFLLKQTASSLFQSANVNITICFNSV